MAADTHRACWEEGALNTLEGEYREKQDNDANDTVTRVRRERGITVTEPQHDTGSEGKHRGETKEEQ